MDFERALLALFLSGFWLLAVTAIFRGGVSSRDIPAGTPIVFAPAVYFLVLIRKLWHSQRIRAFIELADLRMRQKRADGRIPFGPGR